MTGTLQPLAQNFQIVDERGFPTLYFIQWTQERQIDIGQAITAEQAAQIVAQFLADHPLIAGSGIGLSPSGDIGENVTISAQVQAILNQISTTQGTVLFRGAVDWQALAPGTSGHFLKTNGAAADPEWAAGGGGGSSPCPPIRTSAIQANASAASYVLPLPAGSAAGDFCVIFHGGGFGPASITSPATGLFRLPNKPRSLIDRLR